MTTAENTPEALFHSHKNLVYSQLRYFDAWLQRHREDLIQAGMLGLWEAVNSSPMTFFVRHCCRFIRRAMRAYISSEQNHRRHVVEAFVSAETQTNNIERAVDANCVTSLQTILDREDIEEQQAKQNRLDAALNRLPDYRRDLVSRFAEGRFKLVEGVRPDGDSVTAKVLQLLEFLRAESNEPGSGNLEAVSKLKGTRAKEIRAKEYEEYLSACG